MTTAEQVPNPTAEKVIGVAMQLAAISLGQTVSGSPRAGDLARYILRHGNAASSLSEGAPSEEQIERAAVAIRNTQVGGASYRPAEMPVTSAHREQARAALTAAGVAPQGPCPQPCEHLSAEDAREGRDCREHPCTCPTAPSSDREKLIEEARAVAGPKSLYAHTSVAHILTRLADALAAPLDPEKVAEVIDRAEQSTRTGSKPHRHQVIARALCEAAKRGDLT